MSTVTDDLTSEEVSRWRGTVFLAVCLLASLIGVASLFVLLIYVAIDAIGWIDLQFLTSAPSRFPEQAGILPALVGSIFMIVVVALAAFPLGVGAAVYLEEYAPQNRYTKLLQVNIANLAGVPSVVYGLLGLALFVNLLNFDYGIVLVGSLTVALLVLPIVIISSQEALRGVPDSMRQASYGMGATKWQTIRNVVLPEALPGILTGTILSLGRAIGETAPLIMIGAPTAVYALPVNLQSMLSAMPVQIFNWASLPKHAFRHGVMAAGVVTLLAVMILMNSIAILIRNKYQRRS